jgi:hypothetical protein
MYSSLYWAINKIQIVDNKVFDLRDYPFLLDIYEDESKIKVIQKCAQVGATVYSTLRFIHQVKNGKTGIYYFPTDSSIKPFVQSRFDNLVNKNPLIKSMFPKTDNTRLKQIGRGWGHFSGLSGNMSAHSTPADLLVFDELDRVEDANNIEMAEQRLKASKSPEVIYLSTPTVPNYGVNRKYETTDKKTWVMKCEHCGAWSDSIELVFPNCIENGFLECKHCQKELNPHNGQWHAKNPKSKISGYWIPRFIKPNVDFEAMLNEFKNAINIQNFNNSTLGLPYSDSETKLEVGEILKLCGSLPIDDNPKTEQGVTAGIDVGKVHHVVISKPSKKIGKLREMVFAGTTKGSGDESWASLRYLLNKYSVSRFVIDAMPELHGARAFVEKCGIRGYRCHYVPTSGDAKLDEVENTIKVNRTESLDASHRILNLGLIELPRRCSIVEEFAQHCANTARVQETDLKTGEVNFSWKQLGADHFRHAFNYDYMNWKDESRMPSKGVLIINQQTMFRGL